jgi:hypothetical protein
MQNTRVVGTVLLLLLLLLPLLLLLQGMNFVAGALLLVLTGGGWQQQQQQQCSSAAAAHTQPDTSQPGRPCGNITGRVSSSSSTGEDPAAAAAGLEGPESLAFGCLLAVAEHVLPGYYSPAMVAPQVGGMLRLHLRHVCLSMCV